MLNHYFSNHIILLIKISTLIIIAIYLVTNPTIYLSLSPSLLTNMGSNYLVADDLIPYKSTIIITAYLRI